MQIMAICREDDPGTIAEAQAKIRELRDPNVQLVIFNDKPINKPHGLNLALQVSRGDVVTIFDAEDEPHPDILNIINTTMLNEQVDVVQSGVQLMNHNTKWFCFLNVLEYFFWFKSSLHFFARLGMTKRLRTPSNSLLNSVRAGTRDLSRFSLRGNGLNLRNSRSA